MRAKVVRVNKDMSDHDIIMCRSAKMREEVNWVYRPNADYGKLLWESVKSMHEMDKMDIGFAIRRMRYSGIETMNRV